ncbi:hypothetical protein DEH69_22575 [Streptomyces sp. PT12]|nr:hypothetical protein DEH69_22575 [Streptomyces sp. PT12]
MPLPPGPRPHRSLRRRPRPRSPRAKRSPRRRPPGLLREAAAATGPPPATPHQPAMNPGVILRAPRSPPLQVPGARRSPAPVRGGRHSVTPVHVNDQPSAQCARGRHRKTHITQLLPQAPRKLSGIVRFPFALCRLSRAFRSRH